LLFLVCWFIPLCGGGGGVGVVEWERVVFVLVLVLLIVEKVLECCSKGFLLLDMSKPSFVLDPRPDRRGGRSCLALHSTGAVEQCRHHDLTRAPSHDAPPRPRVSVPAGASVSTLLDSVTEYVYMLQVGTTPQNGNGEGREVLAGELSLAVPVNPPGSRPLVGGRFHHSRHPRVS
jgi:hypothetical protein